MSANVLLVGETWTTLSVHVKGWDHFWAGEYGAGAKPWIEALDDRIEVPEGIRPQQTQSDHPLAHYFDAPWPAFLGYNQVRARPDATVIATFGDDPFVAVRTTGTGRTLVWTSDIGPHWCPPPVLEDDRYQAFWNAAIEYLAG